jgi:molecular chaperone DnaK
MTYALGIDLGTTYTAAATARNGRAEVVALGYRATSVPTVVFLRDDGRFLVGDAAERRAAHDAGRVAREFKRRVGDPTPLLLGGSPVAVDRCLAEVLRWVVTTVSETEGGLPDAVTVTHPANWGEFKRDVLREALRMVELPGARLLAEPVAAATWYAHAERLAPGNTIAVYDLGGGTFDAAVLRRRADGEFESLGRAEGIERLGGIDVDEAVFGHVIRALGIEPAALAAAADDPAVMTAASQLRRACVEAKEALSSETSVTIPAWLAGVNHEVLLQRTELEDLVGPLLRSTVEALDRVVASAGLRPDDLHSVLLVGGSSRIPLISRLVSAGLGRPVAVDAHPKHPVALGAALDAGAHVAPRPAQPTPAPIAAPVGPGGAPADAVPAGSGRPGPGRRAGMLPPPPPPRRPGANGTATATPQDAPAIRTLPPLPPIAPMAPDKSSRRLLMFASLATPVALVLVILLNVMQNQDRLDGNAGTTGSTLATGPGVTSPLGTPATEPSDDGDGSTNFFNDPGPVLAAFAGIHGETPPRVLDVRLYLDYAYMSAQSLEEPTFADEYRYGEGQVSGPEPSPITPEPLEPELFALSDIDPAVIPGLTQQAFSNCTSEGLELTHVLIERDTDGNFDDQRRPLIHVYMGHPVRSGPGGYVTYAPDGTQLADYCD